jgi:hypothetical protein
MATRRRPPAAPPHTNPLHTGPAAHWAVTAEPRQEADLSHNVIMTASGGASERLGPEFAYCSWA